MLEPQKTFFIENTLPKLMKERKVPGISLAVIEDNAIAWHLEMGVKNSKTYEPVEKNTLFEAASLSKPVFAYGVLQLVEKGKLDLDMPLRRYLKYSEIDNDERVDLITARMVLAHTTGLPNWRPENESLKIHFRPGERFSYSGEGFVFLQKVLEKITGESLEEYFRKNVFIPLGMKQSTFNWINNKSEKLKAFGHNVDGFPIENQEGILPNSAFTLQTNALDYAKFVLAILKGEGLRSETIKEMLIPQIQVQEGCIITTEKSCPPLSEFVSWGLGWGLQQTSLGHSFWHWGDNQGFKCFIVGFKKCNKAVITFTNSANGLSIISDILYKMLRIPQPSLEWLEPTYTQKNKQ
jgi:CubicO group peptidase (beta-lactamase class C family)